jgi:amidohydrolase
MGRFDNLKEEARKIHKQIVEWRRHLHQHPEVGLEVPETEKFVAERLREMGLEVRTGVGGHGVVAVLKGAKPGKTIAVRSDMDALDVKEETGLPFASKVEGKMHACGHDAHMAMALGAAKLLSVRSSELSGNVKFIFQPAEEGPGGAKPMIEDGALENPKVDAIIGLHTGCIWDFQKPGEVYVGYGSMMASLDRIDVTIKGKGAHGAMPQKSVDAVSVAAHAISTVQTVVSREISPLDPAVVTIGKIHGGTAYNIIAEEVSFEGTVRSLKQDVREFLDKRIGEIIKGVASSMRAEAKYTYTYGYPPLVNDADFTKRFAEVAQEVVGPELVKEIAEPTMGGEDMAYFLNEVPGTFFFLAGSKEVDGQVYPHHNSKFDIDEDILWEGALLESAAVIDYLSS